VSCYDQVRGLNFVQIPLWTIVTFYDAVNFKKREGVQIPLWTIVTDPPWSYRDKCNAFRFLYGRL